MRKPFYSFCKTFFINKLHSFSAAFLILVLLYMPARSNCQVYFVTNDASGSSKSSTDAINRMNYDGTAATNIVSSFTNSPTILALDLPNNRAFVYESFSSSPPTNLSIRVVNLVTGVITTTIPVTLTGRIIAIRYDAVNDVIYYITQDAAPTTSSSNDALVRVKPDGTGSTVIASGFCKNPAFLALNIAAGRAYVYENLFADHGFVVLNLSTGAVVTTFSTVAFTGGFVGVDMAYDPVTDYIYWLTSDNSGAQTANDALLKIHPDGTGQATIKSSIVAAPFSFALDIGNNRAFIYNNTSPKAIDAADLTTGSITLVSNPTVLVYGMAVPSTAAITTTAASSISDATATVGGNISRSDASVTERGLVYSSTSTSPAIGTDTKFLIGTGTGSFSSSLTGLSGSTTYYMRAFASSGAGTSYGAALSFITAAAPITINSIDRVTSVATNAPSVQYTATFGAPVTGLTTSNFSLTTSGTSGSGITSLTGSGSTYVITVSSGTGDGSIGLNLANATDLSPAISTSLPFAGQSYTIDKTAPSISISSPSAGSTVTAPVTYSVTYADANFDLSTLNAGNIILNTTGTATAGIGVAGSGSTRTVTVSGISGIGTIGISVEAATASDMGGNSAGAAGPSETFTVVGATLPITFNSVKAYQQLNNITVEWKIEDETGIQKYEVETSKDGIIFTNTATKNATGNNQNSVTYSWIDENAVQGNNFYRIKTISSSGKIEFSSIVKVYIGKGIAGISVYPNPLTEGVIHLQMSNMAKGTYYLKLINNFGQVLITKSLIHEAGSSSEIITPGKSLAKGHYILEIISPDNTKSSKSIIY